MLANVKTRALKALSVTTIAASLSLAAGQASADLSFPEVELCGAAVQSALSSGLNNLYCLKGTQTYVASMHDETLSFSAEAVQTVQSTTNLLPISTYGDWNSPQELGGGSGQLDVGVVIKASGGGVLNNDDPFPDAISSNTSLTSYDALWGGDTGTDTNDPGQDVLDAILTVDELAAYLDPNTTPVFIFDLADPGGDALLLSGEIYITDADGNRIDGASWALDNGFTGGVVGGTPGLYDSGDDYLVNAPKFVPVYIQGSGCNDGDGTTEAIYGAGTAVDTCIISNNRGSGFPEFLAYAPDFNVNDWTGNDYLFWVYVRISGTAAADEELYLTRRLAPPTTTVPEPSTTALLGIALAGLASLRYRRKA